MTSTTVPTTPRPGPTTTATAKLITRPYIDPRVCEAKAVSVNTSRDITYFPLAITREAPIPLQVIAEPSLPDGSKAYLRSRDLDQAALEVLVARLVPRDRTASIPGFDVAPAGDPNALVLLHEHLNTGLSGTVTFFECRSVTSHYAYRVRAIDGDPVFVHFGIIDVPRPYAVGVNGDGAITIEGPSQPDAPTLQQVTNADPATWAALPSSQYP